MEQRKREMDSDLFGGSVSSIWRKKVRKPRTSLRILEKLPPDLEKLMGEANVFYIQGRYFEAISSLLEVMKRAPKLKDVYETMGNIFEELGHKSAALKLYTAQASLSKRSFESWIKISGLAEGIGNFGQAIDAITRAIKINPVEHLYRKKVSLCLAHQLFDRARDTLLIMLKKFPDSLDMYLEFSKAFEIVHQERSMNSYLAKFVFSFIGTRNISSSVLRMLSCSSNQSTMSDKYPSEHHLFLLTYAIRKLLDSLLDLADIEIQSSSVYNASVLEIIREYVNFLKYIDAQNNIFSRPQGNKLVAAPYVSGDIAFMYAIALFRSGNDDSIDEGLREINYINTVAPDYLHMVIDSLPNVCESFSDNEEDLANEIDEDYDVDTSELPQRVDIGIESSSSKTTNNVEMDCEGTILLDIMQFFQKESAIRQAIRCGEELVRLGMKTRGLRYASTILDEMSSMYTRFQLKDAALVSIYEQRCCNNWRRISRIFAYCEEESKAFDCVLNALDVNGNDIQSLLLLDSIIDSSKSLFQDKKEFVFELFEAHFTALAIKLQHFEELPATLQMNREYEDNHGVDEEILEDEIGDNLDNNNNNNNNNNDSDESSEEERNVEDFEPEKEIDRKELSMTDEIDDPGNVESVSMMEKYLQEVLQSENLDRLDTLEENRSPKDIKFSPDMTTFSMLDIENEVLGLLQWASHCLKNSQYDRYLSIILPMILLWSSNSTKLVVRNRRTFRITLLDMFVKGQSFVNDNITWKTLWHCENVLWFLSYLAHCLLSFTSLDKFVSRREIQVLMSNLDRCWKYLTPNSCHDDSSLLCQVSSANSEAWNAWEEAVRSRIRNISDLSREKWNGMDDMDGSSSSSSSSKIHGVWNPASKDIHDIDGNRSALQSMESHLNRHAEMKRWEENTLLQCAGQISSTARKLVEKLLENAEDISSFNQLIREVKIRLSNAGQEGEEPGLLCVDNRLEELLPLVDISRHSPHSFLGKYLLAVVESKKIKLDTLDCYLEAFLVDPKQPIAALSLAVCLSQLVLLPRCKDKFMAAAKALIFLEQYKINRMENGRQLTLCRDRLNQDVASNGSSESSTVVEVLRKEADLCQEIEYNCGRMYHSLGMPHLATVHYYKALALQDQHPELLLPLTRESAHNLIIILRNSKAFDEIQTLLETYLTLC